MIFKKLFGTIFNRNVTYPRILPMLSCLTLTLFFSGCATNGVTQTAYNNTNPKDIFVFMDGTANNPSVPTNVYRLYQEVKKIQNDNKSVEPLYIEGVGNASTPLIDLAGKALGLLMETKIMEGYKFITQHYKPKTAAYPGDRIFIIGFSRGAFTARSLAGLISYAGVPRLEDAEIDSIWNWFGTSGFNIGNKILELTKGKFDIEHAKDWEKWTPNSTPILADDIYKIKNIS